MNTGTPSQHYAVAAACDRRKRAMDITRRYRNGLSRVRAYSLIEVLVAAAVLVIAIAATAAMALVIAAQQDSNTRVARALNYQEQAARLYQLGISAEAVTAILPPESAVDSLEFADEGAIAVTNIGTVECAECIVVFQPGTATAAWAPETWNPGSATALRTNSVMVVRPVIQ